MTNKYDKFIERFIKVPVQFGHKSKRPRRCIFLGYIGSLIHDPFWMEKYYRISDDEIGAGRFLYERKWKGEKDGTIKSDSKDVWSYMIYTTYARLPEEIKNLINKKE